MRDHLSAGSVPPANRCSATCGRGPVDGGCCRVLGRRSAAPHPSGHQSHRSHTHTRLLFNLPWSATGRVSSGMLRFLYYSHVFSSSLLFPLFEIESIVHSTQGCYRLLFHETASSPARKCRNVLKRIPLFYSYDSDNTPALRARTSTSSSYPPGHDPSPSLIRGRQVTTYRFSPGGCHKLLERYIHTLLSCLAHRQTHSPPPQRGLMDGAGFWGHETWTDLHGGRHPTVFLCRSQEREDVQLSAFNYTSAPSSFATL